MKKYFNLLFIGVLASLILWSCNRDNDDANYTDNDTYSVAYDVSGNFQYDNSDNLWKLGGNFNRPIPTSDVVMVYKRVEVRNGADIWEPLPVVYHANEYKEIPAGKQLKYTFDFSNSDFRIIAGGDFDLSSQSVAFHNGYLNNQTFRIVVVPASFGNNRSNYKKSLNKIMQELNIKSVKVLK